jgi:hypothetical protein
MEDLFINVVAKDMNLADIDDYEAHKSIYFNVDFSNFEETVFDSVDVAITRMYNSAMLSSDEAEAIRDLAKILETYDSSTFDVSISNLKNEISLKNLNSDIVDNAIDVAIHSELYWKTELSNWSTVLSSMIDAGSKNPKVLAGGAIIVMDALGATATIMECTAEGCGQTECIVHVVVGGAAASCLPVVTMFIPWHSWVKDWF